MYLGVSNLCGCTMPQSLLMISFKLVANTSPTAQKPVFLRSWNIKESSKRRSKHLCINFLAKKVHISHHRKVQKKKLSVAHNKNFSVISKHHISINFLHQKDCILHHRQSQNKNFSLTSKYISTNFLAQERPYFPSSKSSKQGLFNDQ